MEQLATKDGDLPLLADTPPVVSTETNNDSQFSMLYSANAQLFTLTGWTFHIDTVCGIAVLSYQFWYLNK